MADQFFLVQPPSPLPPPPPLPPLYLNQPPDSEVAAAAMNTTWVGSSGMFGSDKMNGFGYGIGVSVGVLILITTITLASYYCTRPHQPPPSHHTPDVHVTPSQQPMPDLEAGLDEVTLLTYPKLLYSAVKLQKKDTTASCCSICLADYKDSDLLRLLPDCGHLFHLKCVDAWLRLHPTCPICRMSPTPSPLPTPLASARV